MSLKSMLLSMFAIFAANAIQSTALAGGCQGTLDGVDPTGRVDYFFNKTSPSPGSCAGELRQFACDHKDQCKSQGGKYKRIIGSGFWQPDPNRSTASDGVKAGYIADVCKMPCRDREPPTPRVR